MNRDADIARDPYKKCNYFLSLFEGSDTEGWIQIMDDWLEAVTVDSTILPWRMKEWQVMEREFKKAFVDYAESEKANDELRKLKMKDGNVDTYIARFTQLAHRGGHNPDQPKLLHLFGQGLPQTLANKCLELNDPNTFEEWTKAAQQNHKIYLKQLALKGAFNNTPNAKPQNSPFAGLQWRSANQNRGAQGQKNPRNATPRDPNAMDMSATIRKAVTEADKQKHRQEWRCFRCSKIGHIARACPNRPAKAAATTEGEAPPQYKELTKGDRLADFTLKLSDKERDTFIRKVMGDEPMKDFPEA
jgi:hypothetical protein